MKIRVSLKYFVNDCSSSFTLTPDPVFFVKKFTDHTC